MGNGSTEACTEARPGTDPPGGGKPGSTGPDGFSSYEAAQRFLDARVNIERTKPARVGADAFKLDRMRALLDRLDNPERVTRFVHIAGSKGKGSVTEMLAACLSSCGYATGVFTSPHLVDVRERVRIDDRLIDEGSFQDLMSRLAHASSKLPRSMGEPTYFELMTAMAFLYFAEQAVDIAVMEVGLGGRLDCTNVITPEVCAITAIQLEHTALLGDTLDKIAREKAGIIKPGIPAITIPQRDEVMLALRDTAEQVGAPLSVLGQDVDFSWRFEASPDLGPHARVCLSSPRSAYEHLPVPLQGEHQAYNCGLALGLLDALRDRGFDVPERQVALGLAKTPRHGRMELAWDAPRIILDGAHTPESLEGLIKAIGAHVRYDSMVMVYGCAADKNVAQMLTRIGLGADKVIFTRSTTNPRAMDPQDLHRLFGEISGKMAQVAPNLEEALNLAARAVGRDDLICVTGSFYLVGEAKRYLQELAERRRKANAATKAKVQTPQHRSQPHT